MSAKLLTKCLLTGRSLFYCSGMLLCILGYGCKEHPTTAEIHSLASLRCRASHLKTERFALADRIRAIEEKKPVDSVLVDSLNRRGQQLKSISLLLADSIQSVLDSYFTTRFTSREEKNRFLEMVEKKMETMRCE